MSARTVCFGMLLGALLLFPSPARAQAGAEDDKIDKLIQAVDTLSKQVESMQATIDRSVTPEDLEALKADMAAAIRENNAEILKLKTDHDSTIAVLAQQGREQGDILDAIATNDSGGRPLVNVRAIMSNATGREEMAAAVHESMPRQGTLRVESRMDLGYNLLVNGTRYYVPARSTREFTVPVGTVTTELEGYESVKSWTISPPEYVQSIVVGPSARRSVVVGPPIYIEPYPILWW